MEEKCCQGRKGWVVNSVNTALRYKPAAGPTWIGGGGGAQGTVLGTGQVWWRFWVPFEFLSLVVISFWCGISARTLFSDWLFLRPHLGKDVLSQDSSLLRSLYASNRRDDQLLRHYETLVSWLLKSQNNGELCSIFSSPFSKKKRHSQHLTLWWQAAITPWLYSSA